jgi:hypothetical protein
MRTTLVFVLALAMAACGSSTPAPGGHDGGGGSAGASSGSAGSSGTNGGGGSTGTSGANGGAGTSGVGGASGASGAGGGPGGQPIGSVCANTGNCSQADGAAVCCINTCVLQGQCPMGNQFLACASASDCSKYGGGKVCCQAGGGMGNFCTKPSGCSGTTLP